MALRRLFGGKVSGLAIVTAALLFFFLTVQFRTRYDGRFGLGVASAAPEVEIVVASQTFEDTSWVAKYLPGWAHSIYVTNDPGARLSVPKNKGREAMVYLTHLIDRYDTLANSTVFVHASRFAWHNDDPDYDALATLRRLQLDFVQASGYVNLRCVWVVGCPVEFRPLADALEATAEQDRDPKKPPTTKQVFKKAFEELMPGVSMPHVIGVACCSQFAISREAAHRWTKGDYIRWREWLLNTELDDELSGRVLEYMWHIIFGKNSVYCPLAKQCYCKVYGLCDLDCEEDKCKGRYVLPKVSTLPGGWPEIGWSGEHRNFSGPL
ncbi:hypothetical protein QBC34DRAFT_24371 [Podospora aff. communis PSN243]|uniref:Uncharacterized protein n=1 Tax=Podospora aff. communis PSN243 TaxID=3040156 RepID=A0AAV9G5X6_9PEZI|nr:hypothetical protein QBC34DRAFT_24371 [Podospora aff. communis PSN243]